MERIEINEFENYFPTGFDFYGMASVSLTDTQKERPELAELLQDSEAIAYDILPDETSDRFLLVITKDQKLDSSLYAEVGNVIASKIAASIAKSKSAADCFISHPQTLSSNQLKALSKYRLDFSLASYEFDQQGESTTLFAIVLPLSSSRVGHV